MIGLTKMALPIGLIVIVIVTFLLGLRTRGTTASRPLVIIVYGITFGLGWVYVAQRSLDTNVKAYNVCVSRVERSEGNRAQWLALAQRFDDATGTAKYGDQIRADLDHNLPKLDIDDCKKP